MVHYTFEIDYTQWGLDWKPLSTWNFDKQIKEFMDYHIKTIRRFNEYTKDLDNDFIPAIGPSIGAGVNSAFFSGAEVIMGDETSWVHPVIREWEDMEKLKMDKNNAWLNIFEKYYGIQ